jgi:nicotinate-nucleotide adenylyltransferase
VQDQVARHQILPTISKRPPHHANIPRWGDRRAIRLGLLGGSFNPAHGGHAHIAQAALKRLRLDQVWLLVSPGNPLKPAPDMASPPERLASARTIAASADSSGRRIVATDIERALGTRFTWQTLRAIRLRFPRAHIVWLMGADNLEQFPHWRRWMTIARETQIAVLPRPTYNERALAGQAARRLRKFRIPAHRATALAQLSAPRCVFLLTRQNTLSATALRRAHDKTPGEPK